MRSTYRGNWRLCSLGGRSILDTYEGERISFARTLVSTTDKLFRAVVQENTLGKILGTIVFPYLFPFRLGSTAAHTLQFRLVSQTRINYRGSPLSEGTVGRVHGGDRLAWVETADGGNFDPLKSLDWQIHIYGQAGPVLCGRGVGNPFA